MKKAFILNIVLLVATAAVFGPAVTNTFLALDDWAYITQNTQVVQGLTLASARWAATALYSSNWHPLTWLSHMLDVQLFGLAPAGHHLTSVLLHAASAMLLFWFLRGTTGAIWPSIWTALAFAIHPLRVESVAWAAERKDVLSGLLWMLTLATYAGFARRPGPGRRVAVLLAFALGLAAKPMVVTLPAVLLLLDYWPLGRLRGRREFVRCLLEKVPLLLLSALSAAVTFEAQAHALTSAQAIPIVTRLDNALVSAAVYLGKTAWPFGLSILYPLEPGGPGSAATAAAALALLALSAIAVRSRLHRPFVFTGWCWYLISLAPVLGLIQVGTQSRADRYTYLPSVGLCIAATWTLWSAARPSRALRLRLAAAGACLVLAWGAAAGRYVRIWHDGTTLFEHALRTTQGNWLVRLSLGVELAGSARYDEAIAQFQSFATHLPEHPEGHFNLGLAYQQKGDTERAIAAFREAVRLQPDNATARSRLGQLLLGGDPAGSGRLDEAIEQFGVLVALRPRDADAHYFLGRAWHRKEELARATGEYREAVRLQPAHARARNDLGIALAQAGDHAAAIEQFRAALRLQPDLLEARRNIEQALGSASPR